MISLTSLEALVGQQIGLSDWFEIGPVRVALFEHAVESQPVDRVPPFLLLSLLPYLFSGVMLPTGNPRATINYGLERLESGSVVVVGERVRARALLEGVERIGDSIQIRRRVIVETEDSQMALDAVTITRLVY